MSSAGLFGLLLMNVSKASFIALMNPSLRVKQQCATLSILSLKSSRSCTMSLSFSGVHTISPPKAWEKRQFQQGSSVSDSNVGRCVYFWGSVYLYIIPPELQQCGKSSFHLAEELVKEGQLSHAILIQQGAQTCNTHITLFVVQKHNPITVFVFLNCIVIKIAEEGACLVWVFDINVQYFHTSSKASHPSVILQLCVLLKAVFQHSQWVVSWNNRKLT